MTHETMELKEWYKQLKPEHEQRALREYNAEFNNCCNTLAGAIDYGLIYHAVPYSHQDIFWSVIMNELLDEAYFSSNS